MVGWVGREALPGRLHRLAFLGGPQVGFGIRRAVYGRRALVTVYRPLCQRMTGPYREMVWSKQSVRTFRGRRGLGVIYLFHTRRLTQRERHGSYYSDMIGVAGKTTNSNVFSALPLDLASGVSLWQFSYPSQHFLFGCFTGPMQSVTAPYNSPLDNLWVGRSKEDGTPNHSVFPVDHCVPLIVRSIRVKIRVALSGSCRPQVPPRTDQALAPIKGP